MADAKQIVLSFQNEYKSIRWLPEAKLPYFSIVTGANGAGKSQLLEAIRNGSVRVEGLPSNGGGFVHHNWQTFVPDLGQDAHVHPSAHERLDHKRNCANHWNAVRQQLVQSVKRWNLAMDPRLDDATWLATANQDQLLKVFKAVEPSKGAAPAIVAAFIEERARIEKHLEDHSKFQVGLIRHTDKPLLLWTEKDFDHAISLKRPSSLLHLSLADWFVGWRMEYETNALKRFCSKERNQTDLTVLSDEDFIKRYGPEPWLLINRVLENAGLPWRVNEPNFSLFDLRPAFSLRLIDPERSQALHVSDLSTGEKILLASVLMLYQTGDCDGLSALPSLILLDEVDAPLHPSYTKHLISVLKEEIVIKLGIPVILTTHSPSTVALAPRNSVFELGRDTRQLRQVTSSEATQILSSGFVSITISDVIVIAEAPIDQRYFQSVYAKILEKALVPAQPPLKFVSATKKDDPGSGGGCESARNWAEKLEQCGLERFRALVDGDNGKNTSSAAVQVLPRYSIENYMFDPLTIIGLLLQTGLSSEFCTQKFERDNPNELIALPSEKVQLILNEFVKFILRVGLSEIHPAECVNVNYIGWKKLTIPRWWITTKGHVVERRIREILNPFVTGHGRSALFKTGNEDIVRFQVRTMPEAISADFIDVFEKLVT